MLRIGLTGGIGAGKSTVAQLFRDSGAAVIDADAIAREIVEPGAPALTRLAEAFGPGVLTADGSLERSRLAELAFASPEATARLNAIMHPAIGERTRHHYERYADHAVVVHDVPLLVENRLSSNYHLSVLVDVSAQTRLERLVSSRGMDEADAQRRISAQAADQERYEACDVVLDNHGSEADLATAFAQLWRLRLAPFADNLSAARSISAHECGLSEHPVSAAHRVGRTLSRIQLALQPSEFRTARTEVTESGGETGEGSHSETVLVVRIADPAEAPAVSAALNEAGHPPLPETTTGAAVVAAHGSADPCNPVRILVRVV